MFAEDLFYFLSDAGTNAGARFYPKSLPQRPTLPAVRYFQVSDPPEHTQSGRSSLRHPRWQLDCFAGTYFDAKTLAEQIIALADGYTGPISGTKCYAGFQENQIDNYDPETGRHWVSLDFEFWYKE